MSQERPCHLASFPLQGHAQVPAQGHQRREDFSSLEVTAQPCTNWKGLFNE